MTEPRDDQRPPESDKPGEGNKGPGAKPWTINAPIRMALLTALLIMQGSGDSADKVNFNQFLAAAQAGQFEDNLYQIKDNRFIAKLKDNAKGGPA